MFDLGAKISTPTPNHLPQKDNLKRETRMILNDFSSRSHVSDNRCFLLYTPISSGRSSIIWVTNSSNLFAAEACETITSRTQWFNTVWTMCHVLAKAGAEPWSSTDLFCSSLVLTQLHGDFWEVTSTLAEKLQIMVLNFPSAKDEKVLHQIWDLAGGGS